jgi:hypothetical protein
VRLQIRYVKTVLEHRQQANLRCQIVSLEDELSFPVHEYRDSLRVHVAGPDRVRRVVDLDAQVFGLQDPLDEPGPERESSEHGIGQKRHDRGDHGPADALVALAAVRFFRVVSPTE